GTICLQRSRTDVNNYNPNAACALRCNHDIKFICSGNYSLALVYYVTHYITK
ncbi:hypothetical protein BKA69DRAFT_1018893, partial [Paraphysoderma sedebokerense]